MGEVWQKGGLYYQLAVDFIVWLGRIINHHYINYSVVFWHPEAYYKELSIGEAVDYKSSYAIWAFIPVIFSLCGLYLKWFPISLSLPSSSTWCVYTIGQQSQGLHLYWF